MGSSCSQRSQYLIMMTILTIILILVFSLNTGFGHISSESVIVSLSTHNAYPPKSSNEEPKQVSHLFQNLRVLVGMKSFLFRTTQTSNINGYTHHHISPSPSPSPSPTPSLAPISRVHVTSPARPERHVIDSLPRPRKVPRDEGGRAETALVAVLASVGGVALVGLVSLLLALKKKKKKKDRSYNKRVSSLRPDQKPSLNPGLDHFYLDSLSKDLEQQQSLSSDDTGRDSSSSSPGEITSVHDDIIVPIEESRHRDHDHDHDDGDDVDDDDQSFHSFVGSNSSPNAGVRLSNASLGSFSDALESFNSNEMNKTSLSNYLPDKQSIAVTTPPPPPPPPPPLPPPRVNFFPSRPKPPTSSSSSTSCSALPSKSLQLNQHFAASSSSSSTSPPGVPPPPCPPAAPPPPQIPPMGKDGSPLPKLKALHWDKVRAAPDQSMVWDKLRSSSFELDEEMIESLFGYNLQNTTRNDGEAKSKTPSPSNHVLEPKRLQNITILSKALNLSSDQVCGAILQGNGLSLQQLEALVKMVPTKEEEGKLLGYKGEVSELGSAERFVKAVLNIPFAFQRVEAMLYRETFEDEVVHLRNSFSMLEEACKELRSSRLFLKLLEAVLKTGNRMNVGTIRGGARAFKLDALLKLADVKGTDGKTNLLHFVVQEIVRSEGIRVSDSIMGRIEQNKTRSISSSSLSDKEEDYRRMGLDLVSGLSTELYNVKKTAAIDLDVLATSVSGLSDGLATLRRLVVDDVAADERSASFLGHAERRLKELKADEDRVLARVREVTEYFHGNININNIKEEANPLRIFVIVRDFLCMLDHVCKELRTSNSKTPRSPNPLAPFR